jgi:ADP-heptose:LPS heptosyltransferase
MNILVVQLAKLGDIFQAAYSINKLRDLFSETKIYFLCSSIFSEAAEILDVDSVIAANLDLITEKQNNKIVFSQNKYSLNLLEKINRIKFDVAINLNISKLAGDIFSKIMASQKFGYYSNNEKSIEWLYFVLSFIKTRKLSSINLVDVYRHSFFINETIPISRRENPKKENIICLSLGTRNLKRNWNVFNFVKLAEFLPKSKYKIYLIGSKSESENGKIFTKMMRDRDNIFNLIGKTNISQLAKIISESSLLISGDTGPMHIASYYSTPTIAIFSGPAYPFETAGYFYKNKIAIVDDNLRCYPCRESTVCKNNFVCNSHLTANYVFDIYQNNEKYLYPVYDEIGQFLVLKQNDSPDFIMKMFYRDFALKYFFHSNLRIENMAEFYDKEVYQKVLKLIRREIKIYKLTKLESSDSYFLKPYFYLKQLLPKKKIIFDLMDYFSDI